MLADQRHLFEIPDDVAYLNCGYMGPLPRASRLAGERAMAKKSRPWEYGVRDFFDPAERSRELFAGLIGARADDIAIVPAASYGIATAAANVRLEAGEAVLLLAEQFPSNVYAWREKAAEVGAEIVTVPRPADDDWTGAVLERLEPKVKVLALPHCHWTDGGLLDLEKIAHAARKQGAALVVDATQSLGALPFDVGAIQPDFLVAAAYKWLLGPYGYGFLYVAPRNQDGRPLEHNWIARGGSERSSLQLAPAAMASLELIQGWDVAEVQAALAEKTASIAAQAAELGLESAPAHRRAGHFAGLRFAGGIPDGLPEKLAAANVYVSVRGSSLRVTPHLYCTENDADRLLAVLRRELG